MSGQPAPTWPGIDPRQVIGVFVLQITADGGTSIRMDGVLPRPTLVNALEVFKARMVLEQIQAAQQPQKKVMMPDGTAPPPDE
jgi:hypothetical protein